VDELASIRWIASTLITLLCPVVSILIYHTDKDSKEKMLHGSNWWLGWLSAAVYTMLCFILYTVFVETSSRKDALIPTKRHSVYLLMIVPPTVILYELFLSHDAIHGSLA